MGYSFNGPSPIGHRIHSPSRPNKNKLAVLYGADGIIGTITGLLPLYDQLVRIFRMNIAPSGGNNDAIRTSLVNLLYLAHRCAENDDPTRRFPLDFMDFIFNEIYDAMVGRQSIPYAPYIMLLIKSTLPNEDFEVDCEEHKLKMLYVKKKVVSPAPPTTDSFMRDARASGSTHRMNTGAPSIAPEIKKLNWFQRNIMCMKIDIHKEQYNAYRERRDIAHSQQLILHHVSGAAGPPPKSPTPVAYNKWNTSHVNWVEMEQQLYSAPVASSPPQAQVSDDEDDDDDEESESSSEEEEEAST